MKVIFIELLSYLFLGDLGSVRMGIGIERKRFKGGYRVFIRF